MPRDAAGRARATTWVLAALNSVEPAHMELATIDFFHPDAECAAARRPEVERKIRARLERLSAWLGEKDYLEDRLTVADLMLAAALRERHPTARKSAASGQRVSGGEDLAVGSSDRTKKTC